jgi:hypothetical protein
MAADFAIIGSLVQPGRPRIHRAATLLHASFRPRLATTPLRFANPSPPLDEGLPPPSCRSCSAHRNEAPAIGVRGLAATCPLGGIGGSQTRFQIGALIRAFHQLTGAPRSAANASILWTSRCAAMTYRDPRQLGLFSDGARAVAAAKRPKPPRPTEADLQARPGRANGREQLQQIFNNGIGQGLP